MSRCPSPVPAALDYSPHTMWREQLSHGQQARVVAQPAGSTQAGPQLGCSALGAAAFLVAPTTTAAAAAAGATARADCPCCSDISLQHQSKYLERGDNTPACLA